MVEVNPYNPIIMEASCHPPPNNSCVTVSLYINTPTPKGKLNKDAYFWKFKNIFLNYGTVPCAVGAIMYFLNINSYIPEGISKALGYIGGLCTPLSLLVLGGVLLSLIHI